MIEEFAGRQVVFARLEDFAAPPVPGPRVGELSGPVVTFMSALTPPGGSRAVSRHSARAFPLGSCISMIARFTWLSSR